MPSSPIPSTFDNFFFKIADHFQNQCLILIRYENRLKLDVYVFRVIVRVDSEGRDVDTSLDVVISVLIILEFAHDLDRLRVLDMDEQWFVRVEQRYDSLRMGWRNEEDLVCLDVSCAYLWHSGLRRRHIETFKTATLPKITLHGLHHTHTSLLMEISVHAKVIQERLGHADATLTMDTYAHVLHTLQSDMAKQFEQLLKRKKTAQQSGS